MNKPLLGVVDIGARGQPLTPPPAFIKCVKYFAIEADHDAAEQLRIDAGSWGFGAYSVLEAAISKDTSTHELKIMRNPYASSFIGVSENFRSRYGNAKWDEVGRKPMVTTTLDNLLSSGSLCYELPYILKVDVQGADLDVLMGAECFLNEFCVACVIELDFLGAYEVGPTAFKIGRLLEEHGFSLFGTYNTQYRSSGRLNPSNHAYSERLFWTDGIFFKDELVFGNTHGTFDSRLGLENLKQGLIIAASYLGFHDYALEALDQLPAGLVNSDLRAAVLSAAVPVLDSSFESDVHNLTNALRSEGAAVRAELGMFVDKYRFHGSFGRCTKKSD